MTIHSTAPNGAPFSTLVAFGWDAERASEFLTFSAAGLVPARVVAEHRSEYVVATDGGERAAGLAGRLRHAAHDVATWPAVGDWVALAGSSDGRAVVHAVLPRRTAFVRRAAGDAAQAQVVAANVDVACIVTPAVGLNQRRIERYVALAWESGASPLVVLTKGDACDDPAAALHAARAVAPGVDVVLLSALTGDGVAALDVHLAQGRTAVLLGPSGAGKSTLVNRLSGSAHMATAAVREDGKGRHTTTHRELVRLAGGALLVDTPGMRELGLWDASDGVAAAFADVETLAVDCRFRDCAHGREPGCAVRAAIESGRLDPERLDAWHKLRRELAHLAARADPRVAAEANAAARAIHREMNRFLRRRDR